MPSLKSLVLLIGAIFLSSLVYAQSGVAIGLYASQFDEANDQSAKPPSEFREIWIAWDGKNLEIQNLPMLMVPRSDGWWRMGATKSCEESCEGAYWETENYWIVRGAVPPAAKAGSGCSRFEKKSRGKARSYVVTGQTYDMLNFVSPDWISWTDYGHGHEPCDYRGFDWNYDFRVGKLSYSKPIGFSEVMGEDESAVMKKVIVDSLPKGPLPERDSCPEDPDADELQWSIGRKNGAWRADAHMDSPICPLDGFMDLDLPRKMVGPTMPGDEWSDLAKKIPGTIDAMKSPAGDLLVIQVPSQLRIFAMTGENPGALLKTIPLDEKKYRIVMIEWATGRNVDRWSQQFAGFKAQFGSRAK